MSVEDFTDLRQLSGDMNMGVSDAARYCMVRGMHVIRRENLRRRKREARFRTDAESYKLHVLGEAKE
jgi:hypothetical protein